jgi:3-phosphoshikimate 1-carboxyvinyltransferase
MLAFAGGTSRLTGVARLREKESDRLAAAVELLTSAGAVARVEEGRAGEAGPALVIEGLRGVPRRASFLSRDDHRVAMSAAVLALTLPQGSDLDDAGVVSKSYPGFFADWERLTVR